MATIAAASRATGPTIEAPGPASPPTTPGRSARPGPARPRCRSAAPPVVVALIHRHPTHPAPRALGPLGQQGRLTVAGRRDHTDHRHPIRGDQPIYQPDPSHDPRAGRRRVQLGLHQLERRSDPGPPVALRPRTRPNDRPQPKRYSSMPCFNCPWSGLLRLVRSRHAELAIAGCVRSPTRARQMRPQPAGSPVPPRQAQMRDRDAVARADRLRARAEAELRIKGCRLPSLTQLSSRELPPCWGRRTHTSERSAWPHLNAGWLRWKYAGGPASTIQASC